MATEQLLSNDLLDPITAEQPAGVDLRWTSEWDRIKEARRADDDLETGNWVKKERKAADWRLVEELATTMIRTRSKDLQLAVWLMEASVKRHGFAGLRDTLRLMRELMALYWENGLYPAMEDGAEDRVGPFEFLNEKLGDSVIAVPMTARSDGRRDYTFIDLLEARRVGSEAGYKKDGFVDDAKKKEYDSAVEAGRVSMDMFDAALAVTPREDFEEIRADFEQASREFVELEKVIDHKFGDLAPNLSAFRSTMREIGQALPEFVPKLKKDEPRTGTSTPPPSGVEEPGADAVPHAERVVVRLPLPVPGPSENQAPPQGSWQEAEALVRSGQVEKGLAQMTHLAASETCGRNRFQRRLLLAEVCLADKRERLARLILEELAEQIDKFQLEQWESSELVSAVWTRLYKLYKLREAGSGDADRADKLYERLCKLDPWQALGCTEA